MKSILMLAVLASAPAMALTIGDNQGEVPTHYVSWCDGNTVIAEDGQGQLYVKAVCKQTEQCQHKQQPIGNGLVVNGQCTTKK